MKIDFWSYLAKWIPSEKDPIQDGYDLLEIQSAGQNFVHVITKFFRFQHFWRTTRVTTCAAFGQLDTKNELGYSGELIRTCSGKNSNWATKKTCDF